jgi:hypothetical protein
MWTLRRCAQESVVADRGGAKPTVAPNAIGQFQTFASGSYRRRQLTTVAVYRASFAQASLAAEGRARSLRNAQPVAYFPSQNG